ncbi:MAG: TonB-dependent receptor [Methyloprofundus sp.]|nr:TonB-dependent receptor [Methyloprofundus sp.]
MELKKSKTALFTLPIISTLFLSSATYAEEETDQTTVHEADPSAITLESMVISSDQVPEAFEEIKLIQEDIGVATDAADILKKIPGISVTRQGGTASDPILRGLGGSRLNISIDGVPFGGVCNHRMDPATAYVSPASLEALTVLKGPQSVKYGIGIAGAVNLDRKEVRYDQVGAEVNANYLYGSYNYQSLSVNSSVGYENGYLAYSHNNNRGDNYSDGDGNEIKQTFYDTSNDRLAIGFTPDEDTLLEAYGLRSDGVIGNATIHMDVTKLDRKNAGVHFKRENIASWLHSVDILYDYTTVDHDMDNFTYRDVDPFHEYLLMAQYLNQHIAKIDFVSDITPDIELITGLKYLNQSYDANAASGYKETGTIPPSTGSDLPKNHILDFDKTSAYAELKYQMTEGLRWVSGFAIDSLGTRTGTMHAAGETSTIVLVPSSNQYRRQNLFGGFLRAEYTAENIPVSMALGYGHSERAVDYWEIYNMNGFFLNPEKNNQVDAQISYEGDKFTARLSAYYSHITDFILVHLGDSAANINSQSTGTELNLRYRLTDDFSITGDLSYMYAENLTQNTPLPQTPPLEGNIGLTYDDQVFYGSINTRLVNKQDRVQPLYGSVLALDTTPTAGFVTASLQLGYTPHPLVKFRFGIDNLFDKNYVEHINRSASASVGGPALRKLTEPGRTYWGRITIDFDYPASFK